MCTVTIIPIRDRAAGDHAPAARGRRLVCNRDESRRRPAARPPELRPFGKRGAIMPVDPLSDGTWIAVNDAGMVVTLLNVNPAEAQMAELPDRDALHSRGGVIPSLLGAQTCDQALRQAMTLKASQYPPFRLLIATLEGHVELLADGQRIRLIGSAVVGAPVMLTSSGLGDALVEPPRRALFEKMLEGAGAGACAQDAFHHHRWPDRPHLSVCMSRADARTVSRTVIEWFTDRALMRYQPVPEGGDECPAPVHELALSFPTAAGAAR